MKRLLRIIKKETKNKMSENKTIIQEAIEFAGVILKETPKEDWETLGWQKLLSSRGQFAFPFTDEYLEKIWKKAKGEDWGVIVNTEDVYTNQVFEQEEVKENLFEEDYPLSLSHLELMTKVFPQARYTVDPFFEQGTVNMISAPPNGWKSWWIFLFGCHVASGTKLINTFPTEKTSVIIVNEEDSERLIQDRINLLGIKDTSLPIYYRVAHGSKLTEEFVDSLIEESKEKKVGLVMFDSLRSVHDANENESDAMQKVMDLFKKMARAGITVIFTHHNRKKPQFGKGDDAESTRGSSAINAAVSGHISLEEVVKDDGRYLVVKHLKSKVGEKLKPFDVSIEIGEMVSFHYLGEHSPKEQALTEAKTKILESLQGQENLLGRKDFVFLKVGGMTTVKEATKALVKEGKIKIISRTRAEKLGLKTLSSGKSNEHLYSLPDDETEILDNILSSKESEEEIDTLDW